MFCFVKDTNNDCDLMTSLYMPFTVRLHIQCTLTKATKQNSPQFQQTRIMEVSNSHSTN